MVNWLQNLFTKKPNLSTTESKLKYLIKHFNINMYSNTMFLSSGRFIDRTIDDSISTYRLLLDIDITINMAPYRPITESGLYIKSYGEWCVSKDDYMYKDVISIVKEWLRLSLELVVIYNFGKDNMSNMLYYNNCRAIRPYIVNIELIVEFLLGVLQGEET